MRHKQGECSSMCGKNNGVAFNGGTNDAHKEGEHTSLNITCCQFSVLSVRDMIENSLFFVVVASVCVIV